MPGIEIDLDGSSPREMVVDGERLYFTNWNTKDVKYLDLFNYKIEKLVEGRCGFNTLRIIFNCALRKS